MTARRTHSPAEAQEIAAVSHREDLLDAALRASFPASDPIATEEPGPDHEPLAEPDLPSWRVRAIWIEDETEASQEWEIRAAAADQAIAQAMQHIRFRPHHVEASRHPDPLSKQRSGQ